MTTANHPENQHPNQGTTDLGQISIKHASRHNPNPWVVVENPGTDLEQIVSEAPTFREACRWIERNYTDDDCPADIMRRLDDGTLTTVY